MQFANIVEAIGRTPIVRLNRMTGPNDATIFVKLESANPGFSVKDRIARSMIEAGEKSGALKTGMTIIEPTSGNTGIGVAMVAAAKGYRCILVMPDTMSVERRAVMRQFGAEIVLTPGAEGMKGAIGKAAELAAKGNAFTPSQFDNPANPMAHATTTGPEIVADLGDLHLDAFVSGVGTGGTISGAGKLLKEKYGCTVIAVEPADSPVLSGGAPGPHKIQGIGAGFVPKNYHAGVVDRIIKVTNDNAFATARELARKEGIMAGISSGAITWAALQVAGELGKGKTIVSIVCDTGERYLSTPLFAQE